MNIILLFTYGVSLTDWEDTGILHRELSYYHYLREKYDINITFLTFGNAEDENVEINGVQIIPIYKYFYKTPFKTINYLLSIFIPFMLKNKLPKNNVVVKTNQLNGSWIAIILKLILKAEKLIIRTGYNPEIFAKEEKKSNLKILFYKIQNFISLRFCNYYLLTSVSDKDYLESNFSNKFLDKIRIVPNWLGIREYQPIDDRKNKNILSVGRLETQKNFEELIRIFKDTQYTLDIYGEGSLKSELKSLAKESNATVNFYGKLSNKELIKIYEKYKYYVTTSNFEGNPKSTLEALQAGCIVFAKNYSNNKELIENGKNGFLFEKEDQNIVETLNDLEKNAINSSTISKNAHQSTFRYRMEDIAKIEAEIYIN